MISEKLEKEAQSFVDDIKTTSYKEGYDAATKECEARIEALMTEIDKKVADARQEGYNECIKALSNNNEEGKTDEAPAYSSEAAKANLLTLKGDKDHVFCIMDASGRAYADFKAWQEAGSPEVLGIAYTNGSKFMCMHINQVGPAQFGGNGVLFGSKVHTTTIQWPSSSSKVVSAFNDESGASNTEGIIEGCDDSLAAKCAAVTFTNGQKGYMPAAGELRVYCRNFPTVDAMLVDLGGDALKTQRGGQMLHSSTCRNSTTVWMVRYMMEGDAQPAFRDKTLTGPTRVFVTI